MSRSTIWTLYFIIMFADLGVGLTGPILPDIKAQFAISAAEVGLISAGYSVGRLLLAWPAAVAMSSSPPLRVLFLGTIGLTFGSLVALAAPNFAILLLARGLSGAGSSLCMIAAITLLTEGTSAANRGRVLAGYQAMIILGMSIGPVVAGAAASLWSWRASFGVSTLASLLLLVGILVLQRRPTALFAPISGTARGSEGDGVGLRAVILRPRVLFANAASLVMFFGVAAVVGTIVPIFGGEVIGLSAGAIGLITGAATLVRLGTNQLGGAVSDKYGRMAVLLPGYAIMAIGTAAFCFVSDELGYVLAVMLLATGRFGNAVPLTLMLDHTPAGLRSRMISLNRMIGDAGRMVGPIALGWLVDTYSYAVSFLAATGLLVAVVLAGAMIVWWSRGRGAGAEPEKLSPA